jgi:Tol biopolymer transport system component
MMREGENNFDIYIKSLLTNELKQFTFESSDDVRPVWSPDGQFISFAKLFEGLSEIFLKPVGPGEASKIIECGSESYPTFCWLENKTIIYSDNSDQGNGERNYKLFSKNIETGKTERLTNPDKQFGDLAPVISATKKIIYFKRMTPGGSGNIYSFDLERRTENKIIMDDRNIISIQVINNGNHLIYSAEQGGFASLFLLSIKDGSEKIIGGENIIDISVSEDGKKIIYSRAEQNIDMWIQNLENNLSPVKILKSTKSEIYPRFSPNGKQILFISALSGKSELWLSNINGDSLIQITHNTAGIINSPCWSPDGELILFTIFKDNRNQIYSVSSSGGIPNQVFSDRNNNMFPSWSEDGKSIYFKSDRNNSKEIWNYQIVNRSFKKITTDNGKYGQESNGYFYYTKENNSYIWRKKITDTRSELFFNKIHNEDFNNWRILNNNIYFFDRVEGFPSINVYNIKTKKEKELYIYNEKLKSYKMMFDISNDEKIICFSSIERLEVDLMKIDLK